MRVNRSRSDLQLLSDLLVSQAFGYEAEYLLLALSQTIRIPGRRWRIYSSGCVQGSKGLLWCHGPPLASSCCKGLPSQLGTHTRHRALILYSARSAAFRSTLLSSLVSTAPNRRAACRSCPSVAATRANPKRFKPKSNSLC